MRRNAATLVTLLTMLLGVLLVRHAAAQGEDPPPPDPNTRFVEPCLNFDRGPGLCIYTQGADGPDVQREILTDPNSGIEWFSASWNPDGTRLVAEGHTAPEGEDIFSQLFLADADGGNLTPIPVLCNDVSPAWSPDGAWIAFHSCGDLAIMGADGSGARVLAAGGAEDRCFSSPQWSPDSQMILSGVVQQNCTPEGFTFPLAVEIATVSLEGGAYTTVLTQTITVETPSEEAGGNPCGLYDGALFSPDASQIAYRDTDCQVNLIDAGGGGAPIPVANYPAHWGATAFPQWNGNAQVNVDESPTFEAITGIPGPEDISTDPEVIAQSGLLAVLAVALFGGMSTLLGNILSAYQQRINADFAWLSRPFGFLGSAASRLPAIVRTAISAAIFLMLTALFESLLGRSEPIFGPQQLSIFLTALIAAVLLTLLEFVPNALMTSQAGGQGSVEYRTVWVGLVIVVLSTALSVMLGFQPGFLFGLLGVLALGSDAMTDAAEGRRALAVFLTIFLGSTGLWFASSGFAPDVRDLARMLWFAGLQGTLFGVLPVLPDGDGRKLFRWSRAASIVVLIAAFFAFIHFLLQPGYDDTVGPFQQNSTLAVLVMFAVFAAVTGLFWWRYPHRLRGEAGG